MSGSTQKPVLGISSCLLGDEVRYDGAHKLDRWLSNELGSHVEWLRLCPEIGVGMGVPRETVHLSKGRKGVRMVAPGSGKDWTDSMNDWSMRAVERLKGAGLCGYVLKANSPSCGAFRVKLHVGERKPPLRSGRGLFAQALMAGRPSLPVEEEGRLRDAGLRENFVLRVFTYHRWQQGPRRVGSVKSLVEFHTSVKMLVLAHSQAAYRRLGRMVADQHTWEFSELLDAYETELMGALSRRASPGRHVNTLQHLMGFLKDRLSSKAKAHLLSVVEDYRQGVVPLITPLTLLRHHLQEVEHPWVDTQFYLDPYPPELGLRSQ